MTRASGDGSLIAVVGMSCRLPRAPDPGAYWRLLASGQDAISEVTAGRWEMLGRELDEGLSDLDAGARIGGFLDQLDGFDSAFFGISPREAAAMDPQQRLVLELSWEALEDAGITAGVARGGSAGVFIGGVEGDGVSRVLDLSGRSLTVEPALESASLPAVHLACESLREGENELALAGGVHLNVDPSDARDDDCVKGEGGGVVVLKPLALAAADGDHVYCVIRGSAVGAEGDGDGSSEPSQAAQEEVLKRACERSGVKRSDVQYVELHGGGTPAGDPVEAAALGAVLGVDRIGGEPLAVGSAKANVGHLGPAAGIAGLIKIALAIEQRMIPASLNFEPSPEIPFAELGLRVQDQPGDWESAERPLVAGLSSFGAGGKSCHVVLSDEPILNDGENSIIEKDSDANPVGRALPGRFPLLLSAGSEAGLRAQADRLVAHLEASPGLDLDDVGFSLATTRTTLEHRAVCLGENREQLLAGLSALAAGTDSRAVAKGIARAELPPVFVFPGQGGQWAGMAGGLLASSPAFARHLDACEQALEPFVDWSLSEVVRDEEGAWLDRLDIVQPTLLMVTIALGQLWRDCGVEPSLVVGHSQGEIAAAHIAGGLSLDDAARVGALHSKASVSLTGKGGMASVALPADDALRRLEAFGERASLAAINGPSSVVVSGDLEALERLLADCASDGVRAQRIAVSYAAHSPQLETIRDELLEAFAPIAPSRGEIPFHSTVTGEALDTAELGPEYWYRNLRQTVGFEPVVRKVLEQGPRAFIEVGPHPVLAFGLQETIDDVLGVEDASAAVLGTMRRGEGGVDRFATSVAQAHVSGAQLDWHSFFAGAAAQRVKLPTYPFQRERYWLHGAGSDDPDLPGAGIGDEVGPASAGSLAAKLVGLSHLAQRRLVRELVRAEVASVLDRESLDAEDDDKTFRDLGLESLGAVELRNRLRAATGVSLPATVVFDYPKPAALAGLLCDEALESKGKREGPVPIAEVASSEPIAIVGIGCRYPGGVNSSEQLWRLAAEARDGVGTSIASLAPIQAAPAPAKGSKEASSTMRAGSMPSSLGYLRARRWQSIPSSDCCSKPAGRPWRTPASIRLRWRRAARASLSASALRTTRAGCELPR
jgi:acyl transferase domain-containing protein